MKVSVLMGSHGPRKCDSFTSNQKETAATKRPKTTEPLNVFLESPGNELTVVWPKFSFVFLIRIKEIIN